MIRKIYSQGAFASVAMLLIAGGVEAGAPVEFSQWEASQANAGEPIQIHLDYDPNTAGLQTCPTGFSCGGAITDDGFLTRSITRDSDGATFFQTIVTAPGVGNSGDFELKFGNRVIDGGGGWDDLLFSDESFVRTGNVDGIADKQFSAEGDWERLYQGSSEIYTGWAAATPNGQDIKLDQSIVDQRNEGFRTDFWFRQDESADNIGMKITGRTGFAGSYTNMTDYQDFTYIDIRGSYNPNAGSVTLPNGGSMSWDANDQISMTWFVQDLTDTIAQTADFISYDNLTTPGFDKATYFTFSQPSNTLPPPGWDVNVWDSYQADGTPPSWY